MQLRCAGSASCGGPAGGGGGFILRMNFPPKGAAISCRIMRKNHANCPARRGDLLRRAADLPASPHAADPSLGENRFMSLELIILLVIHQLLISRQIKLVIMI